MSPSALQSWTNITLSAAVQFFICLRRPGLVTLAFSRHPSHLASQLLQTPGHQDPINKTKVARTGPFQPSSPRTDPYPVNQLLSRPHFPDHFYNTCGQLWQVKDSLLHVKSREFQFLNCTLSFEMSEAVNKRQFSA